MRGLMFQRDKLLRARRNARRRTGNSLLGEDEVGLELDDALAHGLDLLLFNLEDPVPLVLALDLYVRLALALLVLERAVEQDDARVLDPAPHARVGDVLVDHHAVEHDRVLNLAAGDLLDLGVALDVDRLRARLVLGHVPDRLQRELAHHVRPPRDKLGPDRRLDQREHGRLVVRVDRDGDGRNDRERLRQRALEGADDDDRVNVALEVRERLGQNLASCTGPSAA